MFILREFTCTFSSPPSFMDEVFNEERVKKDNEMDENIPGGNFPGRGGGGGGGGVGSFSGGSLMGENFSGWNFPKRNFPRTVETTTQVFSCEFCKIFKNIIDHLWWLLLSVTRCETSKYTMTVTCNGLIV